jgi:hypothetical protein
VDWGALNHMICLPQQPPQPAEAAALIIQYDAPLRGNAFNGSALIPCAHHPRSYVDLSTTLTRHRSLCMVRYTTIAQKTILHMLTEGEGREDFVRYWRLMAQAVASHPSAVAAELDNEPMSIERDKMFQTWCVLVSLLMC